MRMVLDHLKVALMKNFSNALERMMPSKYKMGSTCMFQQRIKLDLVTAVFQVWKLL